jgi:NADPH:quinone reductase-like Zn-dependent oxidoreductase
MAHTPSMRSPKLTCLRLIPDALNFEQAAALPLVSTTGAQLIDRAVKPKAGQTVLVTGALEEAAKLGVEGVVASRRDGQHDFAAPLRIFQSMGLMLVRRRVAVAI